MRRGTPPRRVSRVWCCRWSAACGGEFYDLLRGGDVEAGKQVSLGLGQLGALAERAGGAGEGAGVEPVEVTAHGVPGVAGAGLDDADEQQREPAEHDVGADAFLEAVIDRAQVQDLLHVAPAALDLEELLVAARD